MKKVVNISIVITLFLMTLVVGCQEKPLPESEQTTAPTSTPETMPTSTIVPAQTTKPTLTPPSPTAEWHHEQGRKLYFRGRYDEAIEEYTEAIRLNPEYASAYMNRGLSYKQIGKKDEALADFEKVITLADNPQWIEMAGQAIEALSK